MHTLGIIGEFHFVMQVYIIIILIIMSDSHLQLMGLDD